METIFRQYLGIWRVADLSLEAFDCPSNQLLAAKLFAYGVEISSVRLTYDYSTNRCLRIKVGDKYSSWRNGAKYSRVEQLKLF